MFLFGSCNKRGASAHLFSASFLPPSPEKKIPIESKGLGVIPNCGKEAASLNSTRIKERKRQIEETVFVVFLNKNLAKDVLISLLF